MKKYLVLPELPTTPQSNAIELKTLQDKISVAIEVSAPKLNYESHFIEYLDPSCPPDKYADRPSFMKWVTFSDIIPYIKMINKVFPKFTASELPNPEKNLNVDKRVLDLDYNWINELRKENPKFSRALYKTFMKEILQSFLFIFVDNTTRIFHSIYMGKIVKAITSQHFGGALQSDELITSAALLSIFVIISLFAKNWAFFLIGNTLSQAKFAITGLLYKKLNSISIPCLHEINLGKVINLIGNDLNDLQNMIMVPSMLMNPYLVGLGTYMMWSYFGASCLIGLFSLIVTLFCQIYLSNRTAGPRKENRSISDDRIKFTHEIIESIRLIKMYTWERIFEKKVLDLREKEQRTFLKMIRIDALGRNFSTISSYLNILLICIISVTFNGTLSSEKVYASMIILTYLGSSLMSSYQGRMGLVNFNMTSKRIEELLKVEDVVTVEEVSPVLKRTPSGHEVLNSIIFRDFTAYWSKTAPTPCLCDINLTIKPGMLTTVIGKIGSGKSTLLFSLLKEIPRTSGVLKSYGKIAYVEQDPIIFAGTIRDNILFGKEYDEELYREVIKNCNLDKDLEMFPNEDLTEIGEKGTNLSGGQKARLSLARALYSQSNIYLLDDPFSALDGHVARSIFNKTLKGDFLKGKIVILTTHHLHFARESDYVILMEQGRIEAQGTFKELESMHLSFLSLFPPETEEDEIPKLRLQRSKTMEDNKIISEQIGSITKKETRKQEDFREVTFKTYKDYFVIKGAYSTLIFFVILFIIPEALTIYLVRLIGYWANLQHQFSIDNHDSPDNHFDNTFYIMMACVILGLILITNYIKVVKANQFLISTNTELHKTMLRAIVRAKTLFFDTTPVGYILNRFSGDLGSLDKNNQRNFFDFLEGAVGHLCLLITICIINPFVLIPGLVVIYALYHTKIFFSKSMILSAKLNVIARSPMLSSISSTLQGLTIIRVYNEGGRYITGFMGLIYNNLKTSIFYAKVVRLLSLVLDIPIQCLTLTGIWTFVILMFFYNFEPGLLGLSLMYLLKIADQSSYIARQLLYMDNNMQSTQRILDFCNVESEEAEHVPEVDNKIKTEETKWPEKGEIVFNNVYLKYRAEQSFTLKGISFTISPGQKVAFVGRTGAGKSSVIQALFRMVEIEKGPDFDNSYIKIDGIDTHTMGLHLLRSGLSIIPQTPPVFKGTIRQNLDPFEKSSDEELWGVLEEVGLKEHVESLEGKLQTDMTISASVFSSGQKQLMCLARTILSKSKVIVLDEATANMDIETDKLIQTKISEKLKDCTIIAVAHRLITIANYDKVFVIDKGQILEEDAPYSLLVRQIGDKEITRTRGIFADMVRSAGETMSAKIFEIARDHFFMNYKQE